MSDPHFCYKIDAEQRLAKTTTTSDIQAGRESEASDRCHGVDTFQMGARDFVHSRQKRQALGEIWIVFHSFPV